jgi:hypothetical protein
MSEQKEGIGISITAGKVFVHFFAIEQAIELTAEQAKDFGLNLVDAAISAGSEGDGH